MSLKDDDDPEYWELKEEAAREREQSADGRRDPWDRELEEEDMEQNETAVMDAYADGVDVGFCSGESEPPEGLEGTARMAWVSGYAHGVRLYCDTQEGGEE
jgi:ribosomal protein S18 acetylase RimI-like enzyme